MTKLTYEQVALMALQDIKYNIEALVGLGYWDKEFIEQAHTFIFSEDLDEQLERVGLIVTPDQLRGLVIALTEMSNNRKRRRRIDKVFTQLKGTI